MLPGMKTKATLSPLKSAILNCPLCGVIRALKQPAKNKLRRSLMLVLKEGGQPWTGCGNEPENSAPSGDESPKNREAASADRGRALRMYSELTSTMLDSVQGLGSEEE